MTNTPARRWTSSTAWSSSTSATPSAAPAAEAAIAKIPVRRWIGLTATASGLLARTRSTVPSLSRCDCSMRGPAGGEHGYGSAGLVLPGRRGREQLEHSEAALAEATGHRFEQPLHRPDRHARSARQRAHTCTAPASS